jgi:GTP-binding protein Era
MGNPNVGKSTLMNALVGENLSIITSKVQTTRHRIKGIVNGDDFQIVYSDTPGILQPQYALQESMVKFINSALTDADIFLYVTDTTELPASNGYIEKIIKSTVPLILVINKIDLLDEGELKQLEAEWNSIVPQCTLVSISARFRKNLDKLFNHILHLLPEGEPYYDKDTLTDKSERFFVAEIVREKILMNYYREIPYSVEVEIESFKEEETIVRIKAVIYVMRDTQKGILIGHRGLMLKKTGTEARKDIELFLKKQVYLELFVKVRKNWRNNTNQLKRLGYTNL